MKRQEIIYTATILVLFFATIFGLSAYGKASRTYNKPIVTIGSGKPNTFILSQPKEAYTVWRNLKLKGRVLVHFGSHLPVRQDLRELMVPTNDTKILSRRIDGSSLTLRNNNYLAAAMFDSIIKRIYAIVPDYQWERVKSSLIKGKFYRYNGTSFEGTLSSGHHIEIGRLNLLSKIDEPVLLNFETDFFPTKYSAEKIASELKKLKLKTDCITISLPKDVDHKMLNNAKLFKEIIEKKDR